MSFSAQTQAKYQQAVALHQRGELAAARALYSEILSEQPGHADALHLLGVIAHQGGDHATAIDLIGKAIAVFAKNAAYHSNLGLAQLALGQSERALRSFDKAIALQPNYAQAYSNRGNALRDLRRLDAAVASYDKAITLQPNYVQAYSNRGNALKDLKRWDAALASYDKAIALQPNYADAHYNKGNTLTDLDRYEEAVACYDRAIALQPNYTLAHSNRGNALAKLKQYEAAIASFDRAIASRPSYAEAYSNRANVLAKLEEYDEAILSCDKAIALQPDYAEAYSNRGNILNELKRYDEAIANYEIAIALRPDYAECYSNCGNVLTELRRYDNAVASHAKAISLKPNRAESHYNFGNTLSKLGRLDAAIENYDRAITLRPDYADAFCMRGNAFNSLKQFDLVIADFEKALSINPEIPYLYGNLVHARMQLCDWADLVEDLTRIAEGIRRGEKIGYGFSLLTFISDPALQRLAAETFAEDRFPSDHLLGPIPDYSNTDKIRIGYFSADFHNHATMYLMRELFELHDKERFYLVAFSFGPDVIDEMRMEAVASFDEFLDVRDRSDLDVAALARKLKIDIAVDLKGYTSDYRLGIFAHRAAPVQVNYLGYPGTSGADYIDYIIADKTLIPDQHRQHYSEKVVYLPHTYQVNDSERQISDTAFTREQFGLPNKGFVFCCFNNNYKIMPDTFDTWMTILKEVDGSVLWLFEDNPIATENLRKEAEMRGVDRDRLVFAGRLPLNEHLARHRLADLGLDTLPYNAHTTASDALWAGLPVLTLIGDSFAGRVAASLLNAVDLPELVAHTRNDYKEAAVFFASHPDRLQTIKSKLQANRLATPLFDANLYRRHLENAFIQMHDRVLNGLDPDHIFVDPGL